MKKTLNNLKFRICRRPDAGLLSLVTAAVLLTIGCASTAPSSQLVDARRAYKTAANGVASELNPAGLHEAEKALQLAERAHQQEARSDTEEDLAYIARRKTQIAVAEAEAKQATREQQRLGEQYEGELESRVKSAQSALDEKSDALQKTAAELDKEKKARTAAEERAREAMAALKDVANVQEDAQGVKITLSGAVLFKTASSKLRPIAQQRLRDVADAIEGYPDKPVVVHGHTDGRGSDAYNQKLSQSRADSVRDYLVSQGLSGDRVRAVGNGESAPIADNNSADGRANNRRVEIVVGNPGG